MKLFIKVITVTSIVMGDFFPPSSTFENGLKKRIYFLKKVNCQIYWTYM